LYESENTAVSIWIKGWCADWAGVSGCFVFVWYYGSQSRGQYACGGYYVAYELEKGMPFLHRFMVSYGVTDEIFGVSVCREGSLNPFYTYGLICVAVPGWTFGTFLGAVSGDLLPARLLSALGVALYGMFLAVVIPPARESLILAGIILVSIGASFVFSVVPLLKDISSGFRIIILTVLIAGVAASLFPVKEEKG